MKIIRWGPRPQPLRVLGADGDAVELRGRGSNQDQLPVYLEPLFDILQHIADILDDLLMATKDITDR